MNLIYSENKSKTAMYRAFTMLSFVSTAERIFNHESQWTACLNKMKDEDNKIKSKTCLKLTLVDKILLMDGERFECMVLFSHHNIYKHLHKGDLEYPVKVLKFFRVQNWIKA